MKLKIDLLRDIENIVAVELTPIERTRLKDMSISELTTLAAFLQRAKDLFESTPADQQFGTPAIKLDERSLALKVIATEDLGGGLMVDTCQFDPTLEPDKDIPKKAPCEKCGVDYGEVHLPTCPEYPAYLSGIVNP